MNQEPKRRKMLIRKDPDQHEKDLVESVSK